MDVGTIQYNVEADTTDIDRANASVDGMREHMDDASVSAEDLGNEMIATVAKVAAFAAAVISTSKAVASLLKSNSDFETGLVGVAKTTNLAGGDLENFKNRILEVSKSIPVTTAELLELSQAAGQMGVRGAENLEKFATVMAKVGRSTDMAGADAARALARILTVSGESTDKLETLANVIVRMGNNSKATESEIAGMTTRISQALSVYGIASAQSVALAAGMKSIGITAEQGGSAVGRSMQEITNAVLGGTTALKKFSKELDLDPEKLSNIFKTDKIEGFNYFLEGIASQGLGAGLALEKIGLGGTEIAASIIPLASNLNILRDAQAQVNNELEAGSALNVEFSNSMKTFDSQIALSQNIVTAYAQSLSAGLFQSVSDLIKEFNEASQTGGLNRLVDALSLLSIVITTKVVAAMGAFVAAKAQSIAMTFAENAAYTENAIRTAASAQASAAAAAQKVASANAQLASAVAVVGAERALQAARIASLKSIADELLAERTLEVQRLQSQITAQGAALSTQKIAAIRLQQVAILAQIRNAEIALAATTVESNAAAAAAINLRTVALAESAAATGLASAANIIATNTTTQLSVASTIAAAANRGLNATLGLMGGPAGAVLLAAGALVYFAMRTTDAEAAVKALGETTEEVVASFNKLSDLKQNRVLEQLKKDYEDAQSTAERLEKDLNAVNKAKSFTTEKRRNELAIALEDAAEKAVNLKEKIDKLEFQKVFGGMAESVKAFEDSLIPVAESVDPITTSINEASDATTKLVKESEKLIALYGNKKKAVEFAYDVEHKLISISDEKSKQLILTNYKLYDSIVGMEEAWKSLGSIVDKEMSEMLDRSNKANQKLIDQSISNRPSWMPTDKDIAQAEKTVKFSEDAASRINSAFANVWVGLLDGSLDVFDGIKKAFFQTIAEMAHEAITKPIVLNIQQSMTSGGSSAGQGATAAIGQGGIYGAIAVAVIAGAQIWNKTQDEKFAKLTAVYKQSSQGISSILGDGNKKSDAISESIDNLNSVNGNVLDVNYKMLDTLLDIRTGIAKTAAGFAKTLIGSGDYEAMGIKQGTSTFNYGLGSLGEGKSIGYGLSASGLGMDILGDKVTEMIGGFIGGLGKKASEAIYSKKKKVVDSGIRIMGASLANIMTGATIEAFNYADVNTTKKTLGIKTSSKTKRKTEDLDAIFEQQFSDVFASAGEALKQSSEVFGVNFDDFTSQLLIKAQDISLKGLKGDELTAEIEAFFGSTIDSWAEIILDGGEDTKNVLLDFQRVGEGAFEAMIRLASETQTFSDYAARLGLNMSAVGTDAVYATQNISDLSGGFDSLSSSLSTYYDKFFDADDKLEDATKSITEYFDELGLSVPKTRQEFKDIISALDLTTEAGAEQFASLIKVSGALDEYIDALDDSAEAIKNQKIELAENAYSSLGRAVDAQKKIIDGQITAMNEALSTSRSVYSALSSALNGMVINSNKTQEATRKQAQQQLSGMLSSAQGGKLPNIDDLNRALSVISQPSENLYGTFQEYAADFYATADTIKQLQDIAGAQVTTEELALAELESQTTALDDLLVWGKAQVDILNGIDVSISTVADALIAFSLASGVELPEDKNKKIIDMAADSNAASSLTPQQQAAKEEMQKQAAQIEKQNKDFQDFMKATQIAVVSNTDKINKTLDKFDVIGLPPERV